LRGSTSPVGSKAAMFTTKTESLDNGWLDVFHPGIPISSGNPEPGM
jgi:hypothetical protein